MSEVPENWYRVTPALAGRLQSRGAPPPIMLGSMGLALIIGFAYRAVFSSWLGNGLGWFVSFGLGGLVCYAICRAVRPLSRKDRDWFAIMTDWWAIQFRLAALKIWDRHYRW